MQVCVLTLLLTGCDDLAPSWVLPAFTSLQCQPQNKPFLRLHCLSPQQKGDQDMWVDCLLIVFLEAYSTLLISSVVYFPFCWCVISKQPMPKIMWSFCIVCTSDLIVIHLTVRTLVHFDLVFFLLYIFCVWVHSCSSWGGTNYSIYEKVVELIIFFYVHIGFRDWTEVARLPQQVAIPAEPSCQTLEIIFLYGVNKFFP